MNIITRWKDNVSSDIEDVLFTLSREDKSFISNKESSIIYSDLKINRLNEDEKLTIHLANQDIVYAVYESSYTKYRRNESIDDSTSFNYIIIVYKYNNAIYYLIDKKNEALKIIRNMMNYTLKNEVASAPLDITSSFLIWLISKVYNSDNILDDNELKINAITGFKGNTYDKLSTLSADGDSVVNLVSTLGFILESKEFKRISLRLEYKAHENIDMRLDTNGSVSVSTSDYLGEYQDTGNILMSKLLLLIYLEIIPILRNWYNNDIEENQDFFHDFYDKVTSDIKERIDTLSRDMK